MKRDKIKRFITCNVPTSSCNFQCQYCYIRQLNEDAKVTKRFVLPGLELAQKFTKERLGGVCYFNLCADGETLIHPDVVDFVCGILKEGHYADIITNGTLVKKFDELIDRLDDEEQKRLFIKFSFHYLELKKHNLMDIFVCNVNKIRKSNISFTVEITPHDELIPYIEEIKKFSIAAFGALPHITVARNENTSGIEILTQLSKSDYKKIWGQFDSTLFDFKLSTFNVKRKEYCYAGDWSIFVYLESGIYKQCYRGEILGNVCDDGPMNFRAIGRCNLPHCFNGHAFLAFGDIPSISAPSYAEERTRITCDGDCWLKEDCHNFFSSKLYETNKQYSNKQKAITWLKNASYKIFKRVK